jgi:predicted RNA-binding protein with TRAM domain
VLNSVPGPVAQNAIYGPAPGDGYLSAFARLDGVGGSGQLAVVADGSPSPTAEVGYGYMYNNGVTYPGSAQVTVPIRKGEYYEVQCQVPAGGWCNDYVANFALADASQSPFGSRASVAQEKVYGPAPSDGFLSAFARLDGVGGSGQLAVVADSSSSPSTPVGYGYMYNNGVTYPGSAQVTVPIRKGQYYEVQCDVPAGGWCNDYLGYFVSAQTAMSAAVGLSQGHVYGPAASDGLLSAFARLDGVGDVSGQLVVVADGSPSPSTPVGYGYLYNNGVTYPGSAQMTVPIKKGQYYEIQCDVPAGGWCSDYEGYFTPISP